MSSEQKAGQCEELIVSQIERLGKRLHQFAEMYEVACKTGDGFGAMEVVGRIVQTLPELRATAKLAHDVVNDTDNQ